MAGTLSVTKQDGARTHQIRWTWTSDGSGDVNGLISAPGKITGTPLAVIFLPSSSAAPTDNYDVVILDGDGADILRAQGANRDTSTIEELTYGDATEPRTFDSTLELQVSNAGASKEGIVVMLYRP